RGAVRWGQAGQACSATRRCLGGGKNMNADKTRRDFFRQASIGMGSMALAHLLAADGQAATDPLEPRAPQFSAKAKNVIFLFMEGAPSQMDLFDPKPALQKWNGKPLPPLLTKDLKLA